MRNGRLRGFMGWRRNKRLARWSAAFVACGLVPVPGEPLGSGTQRALTESIARGPGRPFQAAAALVLAVVA